MLQYQMIIIHMAPVDPVLTINNIDSTISYGSLTETNPNYGL